MKRCAIYVRRSTDEHQASSLLVQEEEARRFVAANGWTVNDDHVYREDAVSRAEFKKRPALIAMLNAAANKAFDVVVTRDETRLGGDMVRTSLLVQDLLDQGVDLYFYFTAERVRLDDATQKFLMAARNFASELEREKTSQRTREHLSTKARRGLVVGGRVYGYRNVEVRNGDQRSHVEYAIDPHESDIVRRIFRLYSGGAGLKKICKVLNSEGIASPQAGSRGTGSWSPSVIRPMLLRERYRGIVTWGKMAKAYRQGTRVRIRRADGDAMIQRVERPDLRIIDEELWFQVQSRFVGRARGERDANEKTGRPFRYLLSGLAKCAECGGPIVASQGKFGSEKCTFYLCGWHRSRGEPVCSNKLRRRVDEVNAPLIAWIRDNVLKEQLVADVVRELRVRLVDRMKASSVDVAALEKEAALLRKEIDRLVKALALTDDKPDAIVEGIASRQERVRSLGARITAAKTAPEAVELELQRMEAEARRRLDDTRTLFDRNPDGAREVVAKIFPAGLTFQVIEDAGRGRYLVRGTGYLGSLLADWPKVASPEGTEPFFLSQFVQDRLAA